MHQPAQSTVVFRFGSFEFDSDSGELRKGGMRLRLLGQPVEVLRILLERAGELVTREQIKEALWPSDTFVEFEHGVNAAVMRLREALGDSATNPHYIETVPRRGYRFIAAVEKVEAASDSAAKSPISTAPARRDRHMGTALL